MIPSAPPAVTAEPVKVKKPKELAPLERRNWLIHLLYIRKDTTRCRALVEDILNETNGCCEYALFVKGLLLREDGKVQDSLTCFQQCAQMNPKRLDNHLQVARTLFLLGKHRAAADIYNKANKAFQGSEETGSGSWEIEHNLGVCYFHLGENLRAKEHLKNALRVDKKELTYVVLAKIYLKENDVKMAADVYKRALEVHPESSEILATLGLINLHMKNYQKAFELLGNAMTYDPENNKAILAAGSMMQLHQDFDPALSKYRIAAKQSPESAALWNNIGMCFFGKKKYVPAVTCLKRAHYLDPLDARVLYNLTLVHLSTGQWASAFHFARAALPLQPKEHRLYVMLGVALNKMDDAPNAEKAFEKACEICNPASADLLINYGLFLYGRSEMSRAKSFLQELERYSLLKNARVSPDIKSMCTKLLAAIQTGETRHNAKPKADETKQESARSQLPPPPPQVKPPRRLLAPMGSISQDNASVASLSSQLDHHPPLSSTHSYEDDEFAEALQPSAPGAKSVTPIPMIREDNDQEESPAEAAQPSSEHQDSLPPKPTHNLYPSLPEKKVDIKPGAEDNDSGLVNDIAKPDNSDLARSSYDPEATLRQIERLPETSQVDPAIENLPDVPNDDPEDFWGSEDDGKREAVAM